MLTSDWIALGALIVAFLSLFFSVINKINQKKYIKNQDTLNKLLISKEKKAQKPRVTAKIIVEKSQYAQIKYIEFQNTGNTEVHFIDIEHGDTDWKINKVNLPFDLLNPNEKFKIQVDTYGNDRTLRCFIKWKDIDGKDDRLPTVLSF